MDEMRLYWRITWWLWFMRAPAIDKPNYDALVDRWEAKEPLWGIPRNARECREEYPHVRGRKDDWLWRDWDTGKLDIIDPNAPMVFTARTWVIFLTASTLAVGLFFLHYPLSYLHGILYWAVASVGVVVGVLSWCVMLIIASMDWHNTKLALGEWIANAGRPR